MTTRPSLTSLSDRLARKPTTSEDVPAQPTATSVASRAPTDDRVQVLVRMTPAERTALRRIALDQGTTVQDIAAEALRDILRRHGAI
jgi:hypothetical protein